MTLRFDIGTAVVNEFAIVGINDKQIVVSARIIKLEITNTNTNDTYSVTLSALPSFSISDNRLQFELVSWVDLTLPMTGSYLYKIVESGLNIHTSFITNTLQEGKLRAIQSPQTSIIANNNTYNYNIPNSNI